MKALILMVPMIFLGALAHADYSGAISPQATSGCDSACQEAQSKLIDAFKAELRTCFEQRRVTSERDALISCHGTFGAMLRSGLSNRQIRETCKQVYSEYRSEHPSR